MVTKIFKVCFLDRDGVINIDKGHLKNKKDIFIYPDIYEAIKYLKKNNYLIVVVTNQSVVGRGIINEKKLDDIHKYINNILKKRGCWIDTFIYCPHHPKYGENKYKIDCNCRKPKPGMIKSFTSKFKINYKKSFMIGDKLSDFIVARKSKISFFYRPKNNLINKIKKII
tara:strand:- start:451 stop:957 length:507 start_codon:yes stop_codon:yes gene_type:complete